MTTPPASSRRDGFTLLLFAAAACGASLAIAIGATGGASGGLAAVVSSPLFYLGVTGAFVAAFWASHLAESGVLDGSSRAFWFIVVAAAVFRCAAAFAVPALSDDLYRYLWDGHVQAQGVNPYLHAPSHRSLDALSTPYRGWINNPDLPTIYPPVAQGAFLAVAALGGGVTAMKLLMSLFDMGTILALSEILRTRGKTRTLVVMYAWSPLAVLEVGWSGHSDPVGVSLLALAALAIIKRWRGVSITAAALSGASKYSGWLALPSIARRVRFRDLLLAPAAVAAVYWPFISAGWGVFGSLPAYAERWRFNDSIFGVLLRAVEGARLTGALRSALVAAGWLDPQATWESSLGIHLTEPLSLAKMLAAALLLGFAIRILRRGWDDPVREIFAITGAALLLAPTVHPWYLLWVAPFLAVLPRRSWTWLTYAVMVFSYPMMASRGASGDPLGWLALFEYVPFYLLLASESARRRLWERG